MKKVILFDIDFTLFNAKLYRENFVQKIYEKIDGEKKEEFITKAEEAYQESKKEIGFFNPKEFLITLGKKINKKIDTKVLEAVVLNQESMNAALYEETLEILETLAKDESFTLGIFSGGEFDTQKLKMIPFAHFFQDEHIHIFQFKKGKALPDLLKKYADYQVYFIDDIREILYTAKQLRKDIITIWIKRNSSQNNQRFNEFIPDATIASLRELPKILN